MLQVGLRVVVAAVHLGHLRVPDVARLAGLSVRPKAKQLKRKRRSLSRPGLVRNVGPFLFWKLLSPLVINNPKPQLREAVGEASPSSATRQLRRGVWKSSEQRYSSLHCVGNGQGLKEAAA